MTQPEDKKSGNLDKVQICVIVLLLMLLTCLAGNILGMELAVMQNDQACQRVTLAVRKAFDNGETDTESLIRAAQAAIRESGPETFMVSTPSCVFIRDDMKKGDHLLWVGTKILAKVPAPALMFASGEGNKLEFHRTYVFDLDAEPDSTSPVGPGTTSPQNGG